MSISLKRFGTDYGGYWIPVFTTPTENLYTGRIMYDCGVGEDASFALELKKEFCFSEIHLFDPTPRAIRYWKTIENTILSYKDYDSFSSIYFHNIGVAGHSGKYKFYPPINPLHVSHSIVNLQKTQKPLVVQCYEIKTIMDILGHKELALLKLDVEGAEPGILNHMWQYGIKPLSMAIDSHGDIGESVDISKHPLLANEYSLLKVEGDNYTFLRKDLG